MTLHLFITREIGCPSCVTFSCNRNVVHKNPSLKHHKQPEFPVVQFTDTASNPETVMVKLSDTSVAVSAVLCPERQTFDFTDFTTSIWWDLKLFDKSKRSRNSFPFFLDCSLNKCAKLDVLRIVKVLGLFAIVVKFVWFCKSWILPGGQEKIDCEYV